MSAVYSRRSALPCRPTCARPRLSLRLIVPGRGRRGANDNIPMLKSLGKHSFLIESVEEGGWGISIAPNGHSPGPVQLYLGSPVDGLVYAVQREDSVISLGDCC